MPAGFWAAAAAAVVVPSTGLMALGHIFFVVGAASEIRSAVAGFGERVSLIFLRMRRLSAACTGSKPVSRRVGRWGRNLAGYESFVRAIVRGMGVSVLELELDEVVAAVMVSEEGSYARTL